MEFDISTTLSLPDEDFSEEDFEKAYTELTDEFSSSGDILSNLVVTQQLNNFNRVVSVTYTFRSSKGSDIMREILRPITKKYNLDGDWSWGMSEVLGD